MAAPAHEKTGARRQAIPGARMLRSVDEQLTAKQTKPEDREPDADDPGVDAVRRRVGGGRERRQGQDPGSSGR